MSRLIALLATLIVGLWPVTGNAWAEPERESPDVLRMKLDYNQRHLAKLAPLVVRYRADLELLSKKLMQKSDLDGAVFVKKELDALKDPSGKATDPDPKEPVELTRLRKESYQKAQEASRPVNAKFQADFEALAKKLTLKNDLVGAVSAKKAAEALATLGGGPEARK
jgi:hypothetical protein